MSLQLEAKKSRQCRRTVAPLTLRRIEQLHTLLQTEWEVVGGKMLRQEFVFPDFMETMVFVNDAAAIAEELEHYPDIYIANESVTMEITTHDIGALTERDFTLARRIEHVK